MKKFTAALLGTIAGATLTVGLLGAAEATTTSTNPSTPAASSSPGLGDVVGVVVPAAGETCDVPGARVSYTCVTNDGAGHQALSYTCSVPLPEESAPVYRCTGINEVGKEITVSAPSDCTASGTFYARFGAGACDATAKAAITAATSSETVAG